MTQRQERSGGRLTPEAERQIRRLLQSVAREPQSLLMLDYDGTLAPFRKDPDQAFPYPGISEVLQAIVRTGRTRVVIISGRDAQDVIPLLDIEPHPEVWGLHGLQRLKVDGSSEMLALDEHTLESLAAAERWLGYQALEHTAEFKPGSIAVHWRGLSECEVEWVRGRVLLGWASIAKSTGLDLLEFDGGVEIRPPEVDKGDAVRTIMKEMNSNTPTAYLGDDTTDEHAFEALNGTGLSVLVRPRWRTTKAKIWLKPPNEVLDLLTDWLKACQEKRASTDEAALAVNA